MTIEDRVTRALTDEAESIDVDVEALRTSTRDRLAGSRALDRPFPRRHRGPLLAAAASVAVVAAGVTLLTTGTGTDRATDPAPGDVEVRFSCPTQRGVDVTSGAQDEFLPALGPGGPAAVAEEYGAPRWDFVEDGDRATLRLGNADGTLGSVTTYRAAEGGGWALVSARACGGAGGTPAVPTRDELRLGTHGTEPYEPWFSAGEIDGEPVVLDDRAVYDYSGLVTRHRTIQVAPCGEKLCWQTGRSTGYVGTRFKPGAVPQDASGVFFEPDDMVGRENPFGVWAVWDRDGTVSAVRAIGDDGQVRESQTFTDPSWQGAVLSILVVPSSGTRWIEVETTDGDVVRRPAAEGAASGG